MKSLPPPLNHKRPVAPPAALCFVVKIWSSKPCCAHSALFFLPTVSCLFQGPKLSKCSFLTRHVPIRYFGCNTWVLEGCLASVPGHRPFLAVLTPFSQCSKSTWKIKKAHYPLVCISYTSAQKESKRGTYY